MIRVWPEICVDCVRRLKETDERNRGLAVADRVAFEACYPCRVDQDLSAALTGLLASLTYGAKAKLVKIIATWREEIK